MPICNSMEGFRDPGAVRAWHVEGCVAICGGVRRGPQERRDKPEATKHMLIAPDRPPKERMVHVLTPPAKVIYDERLHIAQATETV